MSQENHFDAENEEVPVDEQLTILVSADRLNAIGKIEPSAHGGKELTKQDFMDALTKAGIKNGIIESNIDDYLASRTYGAGIVLATGVAPVASKEAFITYTFELDKKKKPKENEDGSVDFRQLDLFNHVEKGDVLAVLTPAYAGVPGTDVYGKEIRPKPTKKITLKYGKNVSISADKSTLYADVAGHVDLSAEKVVVTDDYKIEGDVGTSTGNVQFNGNITITGNVYTGYIVEATGSIFVGGVVEGATLIAGDQIVVSRGVQGGNKAMLYAKGNIIANFIEGSTAEAGGYITANAIMHSKVSATGDIIVTQKKGLVVGGELVSGTLIDIKTAGSEKHGTTTLLEVGVPPDIVKDFRNLEKEIAELEKNKVNLTKALELLKRKMNSPEGLPDDKKSFLQTLTKQMILLVPDLKQKVERYEYLKSRMEELNTGRIRIQNAVYPGVKITIANAGYSVLKDTQYCQFIKEGADIKITAYA